VELIFTYEGFLLNFSVTFTSKNLDMSKGFGLLQLPSEVLVQVFQNLDQVFILALRQLKKKMVTVN